MTRSRTLTVTALVVALALAASIAGASYAPRAIDRLAYSTQFPKTQRFLNDAGGVAFDKFTGTYWVADPLRHRVVNISENGTVLKSIGGYGHANGRFNSPEGVYVAQYGQDPNKYGWIYVADSGNSRIQIFDKNGNYVAKFGVYGNGVGQMLRPVDVETDAMHNIYIVDSMLNRVQKYAHDEYFTYLDVVGSQGGGPGQFYNPGSISISGDRIYVSDGVNDRIEVFDTALTYQWAFGTEGSGDTQFDYPRGIEASGSSLASQTITAWVVDQRNQCVKHVTVNLATSAITLNRKIGIDDLGSPYPNKRTFYPIGIAVPPASSPDADIAVTDMLGLRMYAPSAPGSQTAAFIPDYRAYRPEAVAIGTAGRVWVAGEMAQVGGGGYIKPFTWSGGVLTPVDPTFIDEYSVGGTGYSFYDIVDMDTDAAGNLYVLDAGANYVIKFDPTGHAVLRWGGWGMGTPGKFSGARGIDVYGDRVYVAEADSTWVQVFDLNGTPVEQFGDSSTMPDIGDVAVTKDWVYTLDRSNWPYEIRRFDKVVGQHDLVDIATGSGTGLDSLAWPQQLTTDIAGDVYVLDKEGDIQKYSPTLEWLSAVGTVGYGAGQFVDPANLAVNSCGSVFVADHGNNRIEVLAPNRKTTTKAIASTKSPTYGGVTYVAPQLLDADGKTVDGQRMYLYRSYDGRTWSYDGWLLSSSTITSDSAWISNIRRKVWYQARLKADGDHLYAPESSRTSVVIKPQVKLTTPVAPSSVKRGAAFSVYGYLEPKHTAGASSVWIKKYKKSGSSWVYVGYVKAKNVTSGSKTKYVASTSIGTAGTYKLVGYAPTDDGHSATTTTSYDVVYVK